MNRTTYYNEEKESKVSNFMEYLFRELVLNKNNNINGGKKKYYMIGHSHVMKNIMKKFQLNNVKNREFRDNNNEKLLIDQEFGRRSSITTKNGSLISNLTNRNIQEDEVLKILNTQYKEKNMWGFSIGFNEDYINDYDFEILRHGFSVANIYKERKNFKSSRDQYRERDSGLSVYGILSACKMHEIRNFDFENGDIIYVSCLIRTWMTALSIFLPYLCTKYPDENNLNIKLKISKYAREEFISEYFGSDNQPKDFNIQLKNIKVFLKILKKLYPKLENKNIKITIILENKLEYNIFNGIPEIIRSYSQTKNIINRNKNNKSIISKNNNVNRNKVSINFRKFEINTNNEINNNNLSINNKIWLQNNIHNSLKEYQSSIDKYVNSIIINKGLKNINVNNSSLKVHVNNTKESSNTESNNNNYLELQSNNFETKFMNLEITTNKNILKKLNIKLNYLIDGFNKPNFKNENIKSLFSRWYEPLSKKIGEGKNYMSRVRRTTAPSKFKKLLNGIRKP